MGSGLVFGGVFGGLRCSFDGVRPVRAAVVDPQLNRTYGVVRYCVETNWHAGELRIRTRAERRLAFQRKDQIRVCSVTEDHDRLSKHLRSDELIPSDIAPEGMVRWTHLSSWTTDCRVENIDDLAKSVDAHLFLLFGCGSHRQAAAEADHDDLLTVEFCAHRSILFPYFFTCHAALNAWLCPADTIPGRHRSVESEA
jgi:hypothetical protein